MYEIIKVANYVDSMEKRLSTSTLQKDLDTILNPAKTSTDETTSQKYELAEKTEVTEEELSKL